MTTECCSTCLITCEVEAEEYVQKIPADQMCWMHLLPLGSCSCDVIHNSEMSKLG